MHDIVARPLQSVYEKLTDISLNAAHQPMVACYLRYSWLRKCHNLMVRVLKADELLTQLFQIREVVNLESINMIKREIQELNELNITPLQHVVIGGPEHRPVNANIKEEPVSQKKEDIYTDRRRSVNYLTSEDDLDGVTRRKMEGIEKGSMNREINEPLENAVFIKQEKPDEMETYVQNITGHVKIEHSDGDDDNEQPLSSQRKELIEIEITRMIPTDVGNIKKEFNDGQEIEDEELKEAMKAESMVTGAASAEKWKETHAGKILDGSTLTPGTTNILEKPKIDITVVKEETSSNIDSYYNIQASTSSYSDTAIYKTNVIGYDNVCNSTNRDVDGASSEYLRSMFVGDDCGNVFDEKRLIERIVTVKKTSHPKSGHFECDICKRRYNRKYSLKVHLRIHADEKPYECVICKVRFNQKTHLNQHLRIHAGDKRYECEVCKVKFYQRSDLKLHSRIHTGEKPFECEICKRRYNRKYSLTMHLRVHTDEKPYECLVCKFKFNQMAHLKQHLRIHTGEKRYECEICNVKFYQKSDLTLHSRIHTGEKPYECEICKVKFSQKGTLKIHSRIHTGEKPYQCEICKSRFTRKSCLNLHLRIHTGEKPYECEICKIKFSQKVSLKKHSKTHTGHTATKYECEICKVKFRHRATFLRHSRVHTGEKIYECEVCKVRFTHKNSLQKHLKTHTERESFCEVSIIPD